MVIIASTELVNGAGKVFLLCLILFTLYVLFIRPYLMIRRHRQVSQEQRDTPIEKQQKPTQQKSSSLSFWQVLYYGIVASLHWLLIRRHIDPSTRSLEKQKYFKQIDRKVNLSPARENYIQGGTVQRTVFPSQKIDYSYLEEDQEEDQDIIEDDVLEEDVLDDDVIEEEVIEEKVIEEDIPEENVEEKYIPTDQMLSGSSVNLNLLQHHNTRIYLATIRGMLPILYALYEVTGKIVRDGPHGMEGSRQFTHLEYLHLIGSTNEPGVLRQAGIVVQDQPGKKGTMRLAPANVNIAISQFERWFQSSQSISMLEEKKEEEFFNE